MRAQDIKEREVEDAIARQSAACAASERGVTKLTIGAEQALARAQTRLTTAASAAFFNGNIYR